jgi:DNA-directed RNA polymerase subunit K/omega
MVEEDLETTADAVLSEVPAAPEITAPPIQDRFLFVDVAAMRAKQLRRGARPRLGDYHEAEREVPMKPERVAMEEVRRGLVQYEVPEFKPKTPAPGV